MLENILKILDKAVVQDVRVYDTEDRFVALYAYDEKYREYKPLKMFL